MKSSLIQTATKAARAAIKRPFRMPNIIQCGRKLATSRADPRNKYQGDAGWSSPVARQAHNLKVVGSNPTPATKYQSQFNSLYKAPPASRQRGFCLSDGRHRMRDRQAAACARRRQRAGWRYAEVQKSLGSYRQETAEEGAWRVRQIPRPVELARRTADGARSALWPLREDIRAVGERGDRRAASLHRGVQQHFHVGVHLHVRLRLPSRERRRIDHA